MIGSVEFADPDGDSLLTATLEDDGTWKCPRSAWVAEWLNAAFSPIGVLNDSPCWGHWSVSAAARCLKGRPSFATPGANGELFPGRLPTAPSERPVLPCRYHVAIGSLTALRAVSDDLLAQG